MTWYASSLRPAAFVQASGISSPATWPMTTARIPKWNSGLAMRISLRS